MIRHISGATGLTFGIASGVSCCFRSVTRFPRLGIDVCVSFIGTSLVLCPQRGGLGDKLILVEISQDGAVVGTQSDIRFGIRRQQE